MFPAEGASADSAVTLCPFVLSDSLECAAAAWLYRPPQEDPTETLESCDVGGLPPYTLMQFGTSTQYTLKNKIMAVLSFCKIAHELHFLPEHCMRKSRVLLTDTVSRTLREIHVLALFMAAVI